LFGICSLAFGIMMGSIPTSVPQFILLGNWLLEADFKNKWQRIKSNRLFWILSSVFLIHVIGLLYTQNLMAGLVDIRIKMPLIFLPLIFFSNQPLSAKEIKWVLLCFIMGCITNTAWCIIYNFVLHANDLMRNASRFMSHIRLGLYLNMAIACCAYFIYTNASTLKKIVWSLLAIYFIFVLYILGLASGIVNFFILSFLVTCFVIYNQKPCVKIAATLFIICSVFFVANYILTIAQKQLRVNNVNTNKPLRKSLSGRGYLHFDSLGYKENGNYILINIQLQELKNEWQKKFPADSFSYPPHAHNLNRYEILIRYLASKSLTKDSVGISKLSKKDARNIQKGISNCDYVNWNYLHKRTYELVCEYDDFLNHRNINGQSLTMRVYFWKAALHLIRDNPIFGVGTGDVQAELNKTYLQTHSPLKEEWYKRPHNQFLTITVALGLMGLLVFLLSIIYPIVRLKKYLPILCWPFLILALVSFILEDTLETQAGLSFYAFFYSWFISIAWFKSKEITTM
jgi:hypothetical protein